MRKMKKVLFSLVVLRKQTMNEWRNMGQSHLEECSSAPTLLLSASGSAAWQHKPLFTTHFFKANIHHCRKMVCWEVNNFPYKLKEWMCVDGEPLTQHELHHKLITAKLWWMDLSHPVSLLYRVRVVPILFLSSNHCSLLFQLMPSCVSWAPLSSLSCFSSFRANVSFLLTRLASPPATHMTQN